jgi:hypothetical protein
LEVKDLSKKKTSVEITRPTITSTGFLKTPKELRPLDSWQV